MSARWSNEDTVAEFNVLQANAMAVDCMGEYALLAGRRQFALVDLDQPVESMRKFHRQSKWEVSAVQWNPQSSHRHIFASACNQRVDICRWVEASCSVLGALKAHTRIISDLDWSPTDPNILSTCSVDTFTYLWDVREHRRPVSSFQAVASASQVKWNKVNSYRMATAHDGDIRIWDTRKGTSPVQYIAGHLSKIYGLDWSPVNEYHLATASQDCHVKFWDVTNPRQPESKLTSGSPVWRARYTPFGRGLVTVVVPQLRRGENSLFLWQLDDLKQPVHTFVGHTDVVLEFQWRKLGEGIQDYQLVTWSKDQSLRLWKIEPQLQKLCGHDIMDDSNTPPGLEVNELHFNEVENKDNVLQRNKRNMEMLDSSSDTDGTPSASSNLISMSSTPPMHTMRRKEDIHSPHQPKTLRQEFSLVNIDIPNVTVDEMNAINRTFTVTARSGKHSVTLTMSFPEAYPNNDPPLFSFQVGTTTTIDKSSQTKLIKVLRDTSLQQVKHHRSCIEPCLRQLVSSLDSLVVEDVRTPDTDSPFNLQPTSSLSSTGYHMSTYYGSYQDASVPFPRTSGARFCSTGTLVCFTRRVESGITRRTSSGVDLTPRALSALSEFTHQSQTRNQGGVSLGYKYYTLARSPPSDSNMSVSVYYNYKDRSPMVLTKSRSRNKARMKDQYESRSKDSSSSPKKQLKTGPVVLYNIACLSPIHKHLGENYVIDTEDPVAMCKKNASIAAAVGRMDLVKMWSLAAMGTNALLKPELNPDLGAPWAFHPFGKKMLKSLIDHYSRLHDVQTLAMLCCVFGSRNSSSTDNHIHVPARPPTTTGRSTSEQAVMGTRKRFLIRPSRERESSLSSNPTPPSTMSPLEPVSLSPLHDTTFNGWNMSIAKMKRSSSWSDIREYPFEDSRDPAEIEREHHRKYTDFLDPSYNAQFEQFKQAYADILYRWQLMEKRAEILKYAAKPTHLENDIEFVTRCQCGADVTGPGCHACHKNAFQCIICHISVRGASSFCLRCGHGGHSQHILQWFQTHDICPTGCGCQCQDYPSDDVT